jgi:hypothetical protein
MLGDTVGTVVGILSDWDRYQVTISLTLFNNLLNLIERIIISIIMYNHHQNLSYLFVVRAT